MAVNRDNNEYITVGQADTYMKIGSIYFATSEVPTEEQQAKLAEDYGITFVDKGDLPSEESK